MTGNISSIGPRLPVVNFALRQQPRPLALISPEEIARRRMLRLRHRASLGRAPDHVHGLSLGSCHNARFFTLPPYDLQIACTSRSRCPVEPPTSPAMPAHWQHFITVWTLANHARAVLSLTACALLATALLVRWR